MLNASVSHSTATNASRARPRFSTGAKGNPRTSRKNRTRPAARISQPRRLAVTDSVTVRAPQRMECLIMRPHAT